MHCLLVLAAVVVAVHGQCGPADNPRCTTWVSGGFCTSNYYTLDYRKATCGSVCNLCPTTSAAACAGTTENANCAIWKTNGYCMNPAYTDVQKRNTCCRTCFTPVTPTTACAIIYNGSTEVINTSASVGSMPVPSASITKVFVKTGCNLKLFLGDFVTQTAGSPIAGTSNYSNLSGTATTAQGFECTCP